MAKLKKIGNKTDIIKKKKEVDQTETLINAIADLDEKELTKWFKEQFPKIPKETQPGLEMMLKVLWANTKVTRKLWKNK